MTDEPSNGDADAKAALVLVQVLILALLEARVVDAEVFRRIADDALTAEMDLDPAVKTQLILRLNSVIQDSYAVEPSNTSTLEPEGNGYGTDPRT